MSKKETKCRKKRSNRGTISVFLVLILVPCIIVACLFGDISRVELSKSEAAGASDLAMYSLMSHFDKELKEYYGLVASCQDIESFYDTTAEYFTGMMRAKGISGAGSELLLAYLESLKSGNMSDFLQVEFTTPATVTEVANSGLGDNAALLEDSIVEFMKYRGPYEILKSVLEPLQKKNIVEGVTGAKKDEPIVEAKQEFTEAEGELLEQAFYSYLALKNYTDAYESKGVPSIEKYQEYEDHLRKIANDFAKVTELITMYYAGTDGIRLLSFPMYSLNAYTGRYQAKNIGEKIETDSETLYCIDNATLNKLLKNIDTMIQNVERSGGNIVNAWSGLPDPTADSDVNPAIYCMKAQNSVNDNDINTLSENGNGLMERYAKLKAALDCSPYPDASALADDSEGSEDKVTVKPTKQNDLPSDWKNQLQNAMGKIEAVQRDYFTAGGSSSYLTLVHRYRKTAESNATYGGGLGTVDNVKERRYEFLSEYLGRNARIGEFLEAVRNEFDQIDKDIEVQINRLDIVIHGGFFAFDEKAYKAVSLDKLKDLVNTYSSKRESWGSAISGSGSNSSYAQSERAEYNGETTGSSEEAELAAKLETLGGQAVDDLKTRLLNIQKDMQDYQKAIQNFKYGGQQVTKLSGREEAISRGKTVIPSQIDISLSANRNAAAGYNSSLLHPSASEVYKAPERETGPTGNIPDLTVDPPELFALLRHQFDDKIKEINKEMRENEERNKEYEEKADKKKKEAQNVDNKYLKGKGSSISSSHGGSAVNAFTALDSIVDILNKLFSGSGDELRDEIYVAEYIMDMFSYSTFNLEGQHRLAAKTKQYTLKDFSEDGYPGYTELWAKEEKTETPENQSLTNQPINAAHNQMNLGELEYILYGSSNIDTNLKKSYENIFKIREALNLVSGFQNFYLGTKGTAGAINGIADAIMVATAGVVPASLTKCILIGVLATMETAHDLERLKAGIPVALYKSSEDSWYYSVSGDKVASFNEGSSEVVDENGIYYSDYLYFFLLLGVSSSRTYPAILLRTGDLIEANMQKMGSKGDFDLSKSRCYFSIDGELKVKPLLLDLPIANSMQGVDTETVTSSPGWCTYKVSFVRGYS